MTLCPWFSDSWTPLPSKKKPLRSFETSDVTNTLDAASLPRRLESKLERQCRHCEIGRRLLKELDVPNTYLLSVFFSVVKCGHPEVPVNARVSLTNPDLAVGTAATYTCDEGYELFG